MAFDLIKNFGCKLCGLCETRKNIVNGTGPINAKILIVREGPSYEDDRQGTTFLGAAGVLWKKLMREAGIDFRDVFLTNLTRCHGEDKDTKIIREPTLEEIEKCAPFLEKEIAEIKPNVIVPVGNIALRFFLQSKTANITSHRGLEIWSEKYNCKIMPAYHPAAILRNPKFEGVTVQDLIRIKASAENKEVTQATSGDYVTVTDRATLEKLFEHLSTEPEIAIDLETTGLDWNKEDIISIGFSWKERTGWCLPLLKANGSADQFWDAPTLEYIKKELKRVLVLPSKKIGHNFKFDEKFFIKHGYTLNNVYFDTMLAHHLIDENAENLHGLKECAWVYTDMGGYDKEIDDFFKENKKFKKQFIMLPFDKLNLYCAKDADCTFRLFKAFEPKLVDQKLTRLFRQVVMPMRQVLLETEMYGVQTDPDYIKNLNVEYTARKIKLEKDIYANNGGEEFNINSPLQLKEVLFKKLKFKPSGKTKKGSISTDKAALKTLADINPTHAMPKLLLEYRECQKTLSTFIEGLSECADTLYRIHTTYKQHQTVTGRLSSGEPNLQQIPRKSAIKGIFVAPKGKTLIEADFAAAEFRWWAVYSQDKQMIEDLKAGIDIHKMTAANSLGISINQVTKKQRQDAKAIVFGLMYGRGTWSISQELGITEGEAKRIVNIFFGRYPTAQAWLKQQIFVARRMGQIINHFGRIRRLPGINSSDDMVRSEAERQSKNAPIQSAASDMTCTAAIRIRRKFQELQLKGRLVLTVHDSLVYEVPNEEEEISFKIIQEEMERPISGVNVPMSVEMKKGISWGFLEKFQMVNDKIEKIVEEKEAVKS